ncbi:hypothetical protein B0T11DRAFT_76305 [Plectosphaerella cucumerina]|uniref:Uncharacterized protein n=1 Tax=Plectosphaerella cucumerina TaxID=40658 RepID=A0A8K0TGE4_9PEZI|nr:hypothetical protein B0T11DRAFT_76305 [Plectosphaerella cucumerina]
MPFHISSSRLPSRWCHIARLSFLLSSLLALHESSVLFLDLAHEPRHHSCPVVSFHGHNPRIVRTGIRPLVVRPRLSIVKLAIRQPRPRAPTSRGPLSCLLGSSPVILFPHQPVHCQARASSKFSLPLDDLSLPAPARQQSSLDYRTGQL